ncbi:MAG: sialidase family protein [Armatimonadota bacterium]
MNDVADILTDPRLRLSISGEIPVMEGLQPFLFCSGRGTLVVQSQLDRPAYGTKQKMVFPYALGTAVSRDGGASWQRFVHRPEEDEVNLEGGVAQLSSGRILMLDTYVMPAEREGEGVGEIWYSDDDWRTLQGPVDARFILPGVDFYASSDDGGHPHNAARFHRSILEMPNGDLLTTCYTWFKGDRSPTAYEPKMMKMRAILVRSTDGGQSWEYVSTIAADNGIGTEGFTEPVIARVSKPGPRQGRLLCLLRTGRDLYGCHSDDDGASWSVYRPVAFPGLDIYDTAKWAHLFVDREDFRAQRYQDLAGAFVDPDLIEMENGVLVCAFGLRIPEKPMVDWTYPDNGNYLAFSFDQGDTWSHVTRLTGGRRTTHYMGLREARPDELFVAYDLGWWGQPGRMVVGRQVRVEIGR